MQTLFLALVLAQPAPYPPVDRPAPFPSVEQRVKTSSTSNNQEHTDFIKARDLAVKTRRPLVIFIGREDLEVRGAVTLRTRDLYGESGPIILIAQPTPHGMAWRKLHGSAWTSRDIEEELLVNAPRREVSQPAVPFSSSPEHDQEGKTAQPDADNDRLGVPKGTRFYDKRPLYQNMFTMDNGTRRFAVPTTIHDPDGPEHHPFIVSGGMEGLTGWRSEKGLMVPEGKKIRLWRQFDDVRAFALVDRWRWRFPEGTVAVDKLSTDRGVFEVRTQTKEADGWRSKVTFRDEKARPAGYAGLQQACASCHSHTGEIVDVPGRIYRRERWGSDGRFSWRPYNEDGSLDNSWPIEVQQLGQR